MWVAESQGRSGSVVYTGHRKGLVRDNLSATLGPHDNTHRHNLHFTYLYARVPMLTVFALKLDLLFGVKNASLTTATSVPPRRWEQPPTHLAS